MIKFQDLSIKLKLITIQLFTTLFILVFFVGIYLFSQYHQYESRAFTRLSTLAEVLGSNSISALLFFDNDAADDVLESLKTQPDILNAVVYDHNGTVFARYNHPSHPRFTFGVVDVEQRATGDDGFILTKRIIFDDLKVGWIALRLDSSGRRVELLEAVRQSFLLFIAGIILAGLLSIRAQKPISNSIGTLAETAKKISDSGDYTIRVKSSARDEIGQLVGSFNDMLEKILNHEQHLEQLVAERTVELEAAKTKAEESDHLKSAFLASMSHELRTPLNSIIGFTGILLQGMAGPLSEEQAKQLGMVKGSASHLLELINDILDISKIESGRVQVYDEAFKIDLLLVMAVSSLRPFAEKKSLRLRHNIETDLPKLYSDKRRLEQVLINLINNAIKFTEEGEIMVSCYLKEDFLNIDVFDTGIGISEKDLETVFETFRQIDTGLDRVKEGSGLGLAISKKLVELLGGTISVVSEPGVGSTFSILLPIKQEN
ncbi:MAG: HAMP domain-containing protein [Candidatus Marinimicrobia bacterium]|nr:HAMP domain-containing protein [Candidatus Neomarinimicrobiota bacterium]MBT3630141.1 HAMP domain-containing protein [Candidatus Neomarinimicrobiota bacterium]MBT3826093.1 HAMP domain-containing protein [Candidatus Neomarinimicrobiota bacterium]MBT4132127.1 HAMP domain-containing protein [Candidatus Neomarinimicrobiota bacterium]MBT4296614.1 HAMP domain-containing protein [Candidatus Neomarinimicrobiota bacterium]